MCRWKIRRLYGMWVLFYDDECGCGGCDSGQSVAVSNDPTALIRVVCGITQRKGVLQ